MLILEIAAGIVLGVIVLRFWPIFLIGGIVAGLVALIVMGVAVHDDWRAERLARERAKEWAASREATAKEKACFLNMTEAQTSKVGSFKAALLSPACVLDGPVVPQPAPRSQVVLLGIWVVIGIVITTALFPDATGRRVGWMCGWVFWRLRQVIARN